MRKPFKGDYRITQVFGNKLILNGKDFYAQWGLKGHNGIDYATPNGTPILAPHDGMIKQAGFDCDGYGWYVKIESKTEGSVLAHMKSLCVSANCTISEGQQVGISDNTGASTGPHLHWGYYRVPRQTNNGYSGYIDQMPYLINSSVENMITDFLISKGYTYPNAHLDVVKVFYEADLKLKSGQVINKEDCDRAKDILVQGYNKEKCAWETQKQQAIASAIKTAKTDIDTKWQEKVKEYAPVINSGEYKLALFLFKLFHLGGKK